MTDFKYDEKETYSKDELNNLLEQHEKYVTKSIKSEFESEKSNLLNELNSYKENELFSGMDNKQKLIAKNLLKDESYSSLDKIEALNKIKQELPDVFNPIKNDLNMSQEELIKFIKENANKEQPTLSEDEKYKIKLKHAVDVTQR